MAPFLWMFVVLSLLAAPAASATELPELGGAGPGPAEEAPDVTIIRRGDTTIEEYRMHGQLYMIRVIPRRGIPYYLVDTDGDGRLDTRRSEMTEDLMVPAWTLFRW